MMIIHQNITDTVGHLVSCLTFFQSLKEQLGNPKKIDSQTHYKNIETYKKAISSSFQQYMGTRKTYNHDIIEIENIISNVEKDFIDIVSLLGEPSKEQVAQLEGNIFKIQKLIVEEIQDNPTYLQQLKENFPNSFN